MSTMTEAQKRDAYHEAKHILRLDGKWQQLMPGTRKPNFKRAAREILRRALGRKVRRNDAPLNLHGGLMHEHSEREAHLLERTLKSGHHDPSILHSFQLGSAESRQEQTVRGAPRVEYHEDPDLPDFEVYMHDPSTTIDYPSHYEPGTGIYHSSVHPPPEHAEIPVRAPPSTRLPTKYEAVH